MREPLILMLSRMLLEKDYLAQRLQSDAMRILDLPIEPIFLGGPDGEKALLDKDSSSEPAALPTSKKVGC